MKDIGKILLELRKDRGVSQQAIADVLGIDRSNYSKYERGKLEINPNMIIKLSAFYGVTPGYILGVED